MAGKVVLITGASRGIGLAMARAFAQAGATVLMLARDAEVLRRAASSLSREGVRTWSHVVDVRDAASVRRAVASACSAHTKIDILVNNAGCGVQQIFALHAPEQARDEMEVNYFGTLNMLRAVMPHMAATGGGVVLNVSSVCGMVATPTMAAYSASKAAVNLLVHSLRAEMAHTGVRLCVFIPGHTATELGHASRFDRVPMNDPAHVAAHAVRAALAPRRVYYATPGDRALVWMQRVSPALAEWMMAGTTRAVMQAQQVSIASSTPPSNA